MTVLALATPGIGLVLMLALQRLEAWLSEAEREDPSKGRGLVAADPLAGRSTAAHCRLTTRPRRALGGVGPTGPA